MSTQSEPKGVFALSEALDERLYKAWALLTCLVVKGHPSCAGDEALEGALLAVRDQVNEARSLFQALGEVKEGRS